MANFEFNGATLDWALAFKRTGAFPVDLSSMFTSYADAVKYAAGDGSDARGLGKTSYIGQPIVVSENDEVHMYIIKSDRTLGEVGAAFNGDNVSLVVTDNEDGSKTLAVAGVKDATVGQTPVIYNAGTEEAPVMGIKWITPDTSTVEGLTTSVGNLKTTVEEHTATLGTHGTDIEALKTGKADVATTLAGYGIEDAYTKSEIDGKLTGALHYKGTKETFEALTTDTEYTPAIGDTWNITTAGGTDASGTAIKAGDNVIYNGTGWDASSGTTDLSAYYTKNEVNTTVEGINGKIDTINEKLDTVSSDATKTEKSDTNGNIKIDGVETKVYTLPTAGEDLGGIKSATGDNKVVVDAESGEASVASIAASTINGQTTADKLYINEAAVAVADIFETTGAAKSASKVNKTLKIGEKEFDGSAAVEITSADVPLPADVAKTADITKLQEQITANGTAIEGLKTDKADVATTLAGYGIADAYTKSEVDTELAKKLEAAALDNYVEYTDYATAEKGGTVKSSEAKDEILVKSTGIMSLNTVSADKVDGTVASAADVTSTINGKAISTIFEEDGVTAKAASKLAAARTISVAGAATGSATFDGSGDAEITVALKDSGVTAGTYTKVTVDAKGLVTEGAALAAADIPDLTLAKITDAKALAAKDKVARTDITEEFEAEIAALEGANHTHDNKSVLDGISSAKVTAWDKAVEDVAKKADSATTLAGYGIEDAYTKAEVNGMVAGAFHYKGTKETLAALTGDTEYTPATGDTWNITTAGGTDANGTAIKAGDNVCYNGEGWDVLAGTTDLSAYYNRTEVNDALAKKADKDAFDTVSGKVDTLVTEVEDAETGLIKKVTDVVAESAQNKKDIATINETTIPALDTRVKSAEESLAALTGDGEDSVAAKVKAVDDKVTELTTTVTDNKTAFDDHLTAETAHKALFDKKADKPFSATVTFTRAANATALTGTMTNAAFAEDIDYIINLNAATAAAENVIRELECSTVPTITISAGKAEISIECAAKTSETESTAEITVQVFPAGTTVA